MLTRISINQVLKPSSNGIGYGEDADNQTSVTKPGITGIAGHEEITTENKEEFSGVVGNVFDETKVNEELGAQVQITQEFFKVAPKAVGDYAKHKEEEEALANADIATALKWAEGGEYRVALHTLVSALGTGSIEGAIAGTTAVSMPALDKYLKGQGLDETARKAVLLGFSAGVGAGVGGDTSAVVTTTMQTENNYLSHEDVMARESWRSILEKDYCKNGSNNEACMNGDIRWLCGGECATRYLDFPLTMKLMSFTTLIFRYVMMNSCFRKQTLSLHYSTDISHNGSLINRSLTNGR